MRLKSVLLLVALFGLPALADEEGTGKEFESKQYGVKVAVPDAWKMTFEGPKAAGLWVDLVRFQEPRTKAGLILSVQATQYRDTKTMLSGLRRQFKKDASLAILRDEARGATSSRPKGAFFEYTYQGRGGTEHAIAAYWLHLGRRYRIFGTVSEKGWRTVSGDMTEFVSSLAFTSRAYKKDRHNLTDERGNYRIYFPETWKIEMPARGPRAVFRSPRPDVSVYLYLEESDDTLAENAARVMKSLKGDGAKIVREGSPATHPVLGLEAVVCEYSRGGARYLETSLLHRKRFYRVVLATTAAAFAGGKESYDMMVGSLAFIR